MNLNQKNEQPNDNGSQVPSNESKQYSHVIKVEPLQGEEKIITIDIPLNDGSIVRTTGTLGDIIKLRKQLELEGKIPSMLQHDEETQHTLTEIKERQIRGFGRREGEIIEYAKEYRDKKDAENMKKKIVDETVKSLNKGKAYLINGTQKTKSAIIEVFIIGDKAIDSLTNKETWRKTGESVMSRETWKKTGQTLLNIADQGINSTFPGVIDTLPHMRKQVIMTTKQILSLIQTHTDKVIKKKKMHNENIDQ